MVDWKKLFDEWRNIPDDYKRRIESAFREKSVEKLSELFRKEPDALILYESIIGRWSWERDELQPIVYPILPYPAQLSEEEMIKWAADQALNSVENGYIWRSARQMFKKAGRDEALKFLREQLRDTGAGGPDAPSWDGTPKGIKVVSPDRKEEYQVTWAALLDYALTKDLTPGYSYLGPHEKVEVPEEARAAPRAFPPIPEEGINEEWIKAVQAISPEVKPTVDVNKDFTYSVYLNKWIEELKDDVPMVIVPMTTPPEAETFLFNRETEGWKWKPEDIIRTPEYVEVKGIWETKYFREDLEALSREELDKVARVKGFSVAGKKEDVVDRILGVPTPEKIAPAPAPVARPPARPAVAPQLVGLRKGDEEALNDIFLTKLMEGTLGPGAAKGHLPEFRTLLVDLKTDLAKEVHERAVTLARGEVEALADKIVARKPPAAAPTVRPKEALPEVLPEEVLPVIIPGVTPPPPVGLFRRWGMPFSTHYCPAHLGEEKSLEESAVLRSPYLESRLRRLGLPTADPLFYELCDYHKQRYGGAFEKYPRYKVEFWVGESIAKADIDVAVLVGLGVSEEYCRYALGFYEESKHLAVQ